jgi:hypothetical protein
MSFTAALSQIAMDMWCACVGVCVCTSSLPSFRFFCSCSGQLLTLIIPIFPVPSFCFSCATTPPFPHPPRCCQKDAPLPAIKVLRRWEHLAKKPTPPIGLFPFNQLGPAATIPQLCPEKSIPPRARLSPSRLSLLTPTPLPFSSLRPVYFLYSPFPSWNSTSHAIFPSLQYPTSIGPAASGKYN